MNRRVLALIALIVLGVIGYFVYDAILGETEEASEPISAIPLQLNTAEATEMPAATATKPPPAPTFTAKPTTQPTDQPTSTAMATRTEPPPSPTPTVEEAEPTATEQAQMTDEATAEASPLPTELPPSATPIPLSPTPQPQPTTTIALPTPTSLPPATATSAPLTGQLVLFEIVPAESEARFTLDEELRGQPTTVVGRTNQVAGQIAANYADLSSAQVGVIQINARTLATDNDFRNQAIRNQILNTDAFEFITFAPTGISGLPDSVAVGQALNFQIAGNLTIRSVTQPVTFNVSATATSASQINGSAFAVINRAAFNLSIPSVPGVANVEEQVDLQIFFVARQIG